MQALSTISSRPSVDACMSPNPEDPGSISISALLKKRSYNECKDLNKHSCLIIQLKACKYTYFKYALNKRRQSLKVCLFLDRSCAIFS